MDRRHKGLALALLVLAPASLVLALAVGSVTLSVNELWLALQGAPDSVATTLVRELRLPRALSAFAVGGLLALAGALLQVLLRNPLADPYILGISGGAACGALLSLLAGLSASWVSGNAFIGALAAMTLVFGLARAGEVQTQTRLLLTGVVVASGFGALISLILATAPAARLPGMVFWLLGDLSYAAAPALGWATLGAGLLVSLSIARALNLLARGERVAAALGENPARLRGIIYLTASLLTAVAVTLAGAIGFVGLIVPHALRLLAGCCPWRCCSGEAFSRSPTPWPAAWPRRSSSPWACSRRSWVYRCSCICWGARNSHGPARGPGTHPRHRTPDTLPEP